jgi:hypothetical protein
MQRGGGEKDSCGGIPDVDVDMDDIDFNDMENADVNNVDDNTDSDSNDDNEDDSNADDAGDDVEELAILFDDALDWDYDGEDQGYVEDENMDHNGEDQDYVDEEDVDDEEDGGVQDPDYVDDESVADENVDGSFAVEVDAQVAGSRLSPTMDMADPGEEEETPQESPFASFVRRLWKKDEPIQMKDICPCGSSDHCRDETLSARSPLHVDRQCLALSLLGMTFHSYHRYVICICRRFIPLSHLRGHFKKWHADVMTAMGFANFRSQLAQRLFDDLRDHISQAFLIPQDQGYRDWDVHSFSGPIAGIEDAVRRYACPHEPCLRRGVYRERRTNMECHIRHHHRDQCRRDIPEVWVQMPFLGRISVQVEEQQQQQPPTENINDGNKEKTRVLRYVVPKGIKAGCSDALRRMRWPQWRDSLLEAGFTLRQIRSYMQKPASPSCNIIGGSDPMSSENDRLWWAGQRMQKRLSRMMDEAIDYLESPQCDPQLRGQLTALSRSVCSPCRCFLSSSF